MEKPAPVAAKAASAPAPAPVPEPVVEAIPKVASPVKEFRHELSQVDRPALNDAVGYGVEIQSHEPGAEPGDMYPGKVHSVHGNMLHVEFEVEPGNPPDFEDIDYDSRDLAWMEKPAPVAAKAASAPVPEPVLAAKKAPETWEEMQGVARNDVDRMTKKERHHMQEAIEALDDKASAMDLAYLAIIGEVNEEEKAVEMERQIEKERKAAEAEMLSDDDAAMNAPPDDDDDDMMMGNVPDDNSVDMGAIPVNELSSVARPALKNALGYDVEIQSHDEGAELGDMYPGTITSINPDGGGKITVKFDVEDGEPDDFQDFDYDSSDIAWMKAP
jgi:hypothetical protein